jgi:uncharacterized protein
MLEEVAGFDWDTGNLENWDTGNLENWDTGNLENWDTGNLENWDTGNLEKCQKHGVSVAEIEGLFTRPHLARVDMEHSLAEERLRAIGKTDAGRYVFCGFHDQRAHWRALHPTDQCPLHASEGGGAL